MGEIIPNKNQLGRFVKDHPIVSIFGGITLFSASFTLIRAFSSSKGSSPYASQYHLGSVWVGDGQGKSAGKGKGPSSNNSEESSAPPPPPASTTQSTPPPTGPTSHSHSFAPAVQQHWTQYPGGSHDSKQYTHIHGLGASTSTTTSSRISGQGMPKEPALTLLERTGGQPKMFGGQNAMLRVPPSVRRRTRASAGFGNIFKNIFQGKQEIEAKKEEPVRPDLIVHDIFGTAGLIPEMGEDMVVV
jgi:hypothetical protein